MKVLLVEDDARPAATLRARLDQAGYPPLFHERRSGPGGFSLMSHPSGFDVALWTAVPWHHGIVLGKSSSVEAVSASRTAARVYVRFQNPWLASRG